MYVHFRMTRPKKTQKTSQLKVKFIEHIDFELYSVNLLCTFDIFLLEQPFGIEMLKCHKNIVVLARTRAHTHTHTHTHREN